jgi:Na+-driven multidrug efflux pump
MWASLQISSPLLLLFVATLLFPHQILQLVYGSSSPYLTEAGLLRWFFLAAMLQWVAVCVGAYEGGMGRTKSYFMAQLFSLLVLATVGALLISRFGTTGAVAAAILASSVRAAATFWLSRRSDLHAFAEARAANDLITEEV